MWLVLSHTDDASAIWAYHQLKARGVESLELVSVESLACSLRWEHRVSTDGETVDIRLPDKRHIRGERIRAALNRMHSVPLHLWRSASEKDREYFHQEMLALHLSWLHSLGPRVLNPPSPEGMCGAWRSDAVWTQLAARAGLPVRSWPLGTEHDDGERDDAPRLTPTTTIVVDGVVTGPRVPESIATACARLSDLARTPLLGVDFDVDERGDWRFRGATPFPDLRFGGPTLIDALERALTARGAAA